MLDDGLSTFIVCLNLVQTLVVSRGMLADRQAAPNSTYP
jgi:hypothetical protein